MQKCGVSVISFLFQNRKALLEPYILQPIRKSLSSFGSNATDIISTDKAIRTSLRRLEIIISNSAPPLISSAIQPLVKNLFLLSVYTHDSPHSSIRIQAKHILTVYLASTSAAATDALQLVEQLLATCIAEGWTYTPGGTGGIAIRRATETDVPDIGFENIFARVAVLVEIIEKTSDDVKSEIFVGVLTRWLSPNDEDPLSYVSLHEETNLSAFANAHLLKELLSNYQTELLNSPVNIIQVCGDILSNYLTSTSPQTPSLSTLNIVHGPEDNDKNDDLLHMALKLLSTIAAESVQRELLPDEISGYRRCLRHLDFLSLSSDLSIRSQATTLISLINARIALTSPSIQTPPQSDAEIYTRAIEYISDPLVPVRAQGLSLLRDLILRNSSAVNVDSLLRMLLDLLCDEDSFVYLNAIKAIQTIADKYGESMTRKLMTEYESRTDVDERVRLAEAIAGVIQRMGELFSGPFAREIIVRSVRMVSTEPDWRLRVSALGLLSVCCEVCPRNASPAIEVALHLFRVNDLTFAEEGEGAAPLRRGSVAIIAAILRSGGIDALGTHTREVVRSIKYLARSDGDETVKQLAQGVMEMLSGVIESKSLDSDWTVRPKIQEM